MEERIILYSLNQILCLIDDLHTSDDIKKSLKVMVLYDFIDNEQYNDEYTSVPYFEFIKNITVRPLNSTIGIISIPQLERFITVFISKMRSLCFRDFSNILERYNNLKIDINPPPDFSIIKITDTHGYTYLLDKTNYIFKQNALDIFLFYSRFTYLDGSELLDELKLSLPLFNDIYFSHINKIYKPILDYKFTKYLSSWFTLNSTINNWIKYPEFSITSFISFIELPRVFMRNIDDHIKQLFNCRVDQIFNNLVSDFYSTHPTPTADIESKSNMYLELINSIIDNKPITSHPNLKPVLSNASSKQLNRIIMGRILPIGCYDIHSNDSYVNSFAILKFRTFLLVFINKNSSSSFDHQVTVTSESYENFSHYPINSIINNFFKEFENIECFEDDNSFKNWYYDNIGHVFEYEVAIPINCIIHGKDEQFLIFDKKNNMLFHTFFDLELEFERMLTDFIRYVLRPLLVDCSMTTKRNISIKLEIIKSDLLKVQNELSKQLKNSPVNNLIKNIKLPIIQIKLHYIETLSKYTNKSMCITSPKGDLNQDITPPNSVKNPVLTFSNSSPNDSSIKFTKATSNNSSKEQSDTNYTAYKYTKYNNNLSAISDLFKSLKGKYISDESNLSDFRKIFHDSRPDSPIVWIGGISALYYFIKKLHVLKLVDNQSNLKKWEITSALFVDINGDKFESNKLRVSKEPANTDLLDKAISHLE